MKKSIKEIFPEQFKSKEFKTKGWASKGRKAVTMSLKADLWDKYSKYCEEQGMVMSRRVEILLEKDLLEAGGQSPQR